MLVQRIITAVILLALLTSALFLLPNMLLAIIMWIICIGAICEYAVMYKFTKKMFIFLLFITTLLATVCVLRESFLLNIFFVGWIIFGWVIYIPILIFYQRSLLSHSSLHAIWLVCMIFVSAFYAAVQLATSVGIVQLIAVMSIAWVTDIGAYFGGKLFGKHQLAKSISPNKTIEGGICAFFLVIFYISLLYYYHLILFLTGISTILIYSIIVFLAAIWGDLVESWLKRCAQVKDSANLLPGHGGIFDRIDSMLLVIPTTFVYLILGSIYGINI